MLKIFKKPTYTQVLATELEQTRLNLLQAESSLELANARVNMYKQAIARLERITQLTQQGA